MRKNMLTLCAVAAMVLGASVAFADTTVPGDPCVKPEPVSGAAGQAYESCMAEFIKSQRQAAENHQTALSRAEAAMEQHRTETGSK